MKVNNMNHMFHCLLKYSMLLLYCFQLHPPIHCIYLCTNVLLQHSNSICSKVPLNIWYPHSSTGSSSAETKTDFIRSFTCYFPGDSLCFFYSVSVSVAEEKHPTHLQALNYPQSRAEKSHLLFRASERGVDVGFNGSFIVEQVLHDVPQTVPLPEQQHMSRVFTGNCFVKVTFIDELNGGTSLKDTFLCRLQLEFCWKRNHCFKHVQLVWWVIYCFTTAAFCFL